MLPSRRLLGCCQTVNWGWTSSRQRHTKKQMYFFLVFLLFLAISAKVASKRTDVSRWFVHGFWCSCASPSHCCKKHIPAMTPVASCIGWKLKASHLDEQYQWGRTFPSFGPAACSCAASSQGRWQTTHTGQLLLTGSGNSRRASGTGNWHKYPLTPPAHSGIFSKLWVGFLNCALSAQRKNI